MSVNILKMSIKDLGLSTRTYSLLKRAGFDTLEEIINLTEEEMLKLRVLNRKSLQELIENLDSLNLSLGQYRKSPIQDLIEARLLSNGYGHYSCIKFNNITKEITLSCDICHCVHTTTMIEIEDGTLFSECSFCKKLREFFTNDLSNKN